MERKARANSELLAKRKQAEMDLNLSESDIDPFAADGDDELRDVNYKPSPQKTKKNKIASENAVKGLKNSKKLVSPRKLTPRKRIERLKQKTMKHFVPAKMTTCVTTEQPQ